MKKILAVGLLLLCGSSMAQKITRTPFLQIPTEDGITIRFTTDIDSRCTLVYRESADLTKEGQLSDNEPKKYHEFKLTGLKADTKYQYLLFKENGTLADYESQYFHTKPAKNTSRALHFWAMGDFGDLSKAKYVSNQTKVRDAYFDRVKDQSDLWIWLGDNTYCCGTEQQFQTQVFDFYGPQIFNHLPVMPVPGNHEYLATGTGQKDRIIPYYDQFSMPTKAEMGGLASGTEAYYSYDFGNVHFIALDSYGMDEGQYRLFHKEGAQYKWLVEDLKNNNSLWTVVYFHHPPYSVFGHHSDGEAELTELRQILVPIFDQYKVDLVLNGHSHSYERSYLTKNFTEYSFQFDQNKHSPDFTKGNYTEASRPFINKSEGTIYAVVGSAGRLDWNGVISNPAPGTAYGNYEIGGSMHLKIEENRLDAEWICADSLVRDRFTMLKQVNKKETINLKFGETAVLKATWPGKYFWDEHEGTREISLRPTKDTIVVVRDEFSYLNDSFFVKVAPQVEISILPASSNVYCKGSDLNFELQIKNEQPGNFKYELLLIGADGDMSKARVLGLFKDKSIQVSLPVNIGSYYFGLQTDHQFAKIIPTALYEMKAPAEVHFENNEILDYTNEIDLEIASSGTLPINFSLNSVNYQLLQSTQKVRIAAPYEPFYSISTVSNACGNGISDLKKVYVKSPLSQRAEVNVIYPNPASEELIIELPLQNYELEVFNGKGQKVLSKSLAKGNHKLSLKGLNSGLYHLILTHELEQIHRKIVID